MLPESTLNALQNLEGSDSYRQKVQAAWSELIVVGRFQIEVAERTLQPFMQVVNVYNAKDSIKAAMPTLAAIKKYRGQPYVRNFIEMHIERVNYKLNVTRPMTKEQITLYATDIIHNSDYLHLSPSDIAAAFNRGLQGLYGVLYEGIDLPKICTWLTAYDVEKTAEIEKMRISEHGAIKQDSKRSVLAPEVLDVYLEKIREIQLIAAEKATERPPNFYDLRVYCRYYNQSFMAFSKNLIRVAKSDFTPTSSTISHNLQFKAYFRKRLFDWLKAVNEKNGYIYRHNGSSQRLTGVYTPPDHSEEWQELNRPIAFNQSEP